MGEVSKVMTQVWPRFDQRQRFYPVDPVISINDAN
jgi:hypothetical protein